MLNLRDSSDCFKSNLILKKQINAKNWGVVKIISHKDVKLKNQNKNLATLRLREIFLEVFPELKHQTYITHMVQKKDHKKSLEFLQGFPKSWVADRVRTGDPRHHKPIL
jgi:hypothetical protein